MLWTSRSESRDSRICVWGGGEVGKVLRCDKVALVVSVGWSVRLCPLVMILSEWREQERKNDLLPVCAIEAVEEIQVGVAKVAACFLCVVVVIDVLVVLDETLYEE